MKRNVILLHGLFGGLSNWEKVITHFQNDFNIHIPLLPIYDQHRENILEYLVSFLQHTIDSGQMEKVILVGNSLGGHVAIIYAHRYPERVEKLVLTGSSGLYENYTVGSYIRRKDYFFLKERIEYTFYDPAVATAALIGEVLFTLADDQKCIRIIKTAQTTQRNYVTALLPQISMPVLLIWGEEDKITPPDVALEFKKSLPDSTLVFLSRCGHAPMMERPEEFNKLLEDFIC